MNRLMIFACLCTCVAPLNCFAQFNATARDSPAIARRKPGEKVKTMLLGTYHFNNPGLDELNSEVDDYFAEKRQKEIADIVARLAKFKPTKVFVEVQPRSQKLMDKRYQAFVKGELKLKDLKHGRSETYQLGFRIAKACKLPRVHCVDAPGAWLGKNMAETAGRKMPEFFKAIRGEMKKILEAENRKLLDRTILDNLIKFNEQSSIMKNHSYYNQIATLVNDPDKPAKLLFDKKKDGEIEYMMIGVEQHNIGAELVGKWYTRNIKIFSNIIRSLEKDDQRVLVIFGQGHIRPIQHFCEDHPTIELVHPHKYLKDRN